MLVVLGMLFAALCLSLNVMLLIIPSFILFFCGGIIFPNCLGIEMSLFRKSAGAASAVMGFLFLSTTGLTGFFASLFKANSVIPIAIMYLILVVVCFTTERFLLRREFRQF